jgi:CubicO group peptidase (beta-lactamase class C family)
LQTRRSMLAAALLVVLLSPVAAVPEGTSSLADKIDGLLDGYVAAEDFAGSVLVAKEGDILLARGYGLADAERNVPNSPDTRFMIGSITKQFTAMLVTQLVEKGALRLDNTIADFLPEFPRDVGERITVEMLLLHTSGLRLPEGIERYYPATRKRDYLEIFIEQLSERGLRFEPGTDYGYSNAGYFILGLIIEQVTGKAYEEVLAGQILEPLGMTGTGCNKAGLVLEGAAVSYHRIPGKIVTWSPEHSFDPGVVWFGSGFIYSTVRDLYKFSEALSGNTLLSDEYRSLYLGMRHERSRHMVPNVSEAFLERFYGKFGNGFVGEVSLVKDPDTGQETSLYWHDGTMYLFKSAHYRWADEGLVIIVLSNSSLRLVNDEIVLRIHEMVNGRPYQDVRLKRPLWQYVEEDIGTHAGLEAAVSEYYRLRADTLTFAVPSPGRVHRAVMGHVLRTQGMDAMAEMAQELRNAEPCEIDEGTLNNLGYELLQDGFVEDAVAVFKLNVVLFPDYANGYDSLGEAYLTRGDRALAIQNYEKSLELDPQNENAVKVLERLKKEY